MRSPTTHRVVVLTVDRGRDARRFEKALDREATRSGIGPGSISITDDATVLEDLDDPSSLPAVLVVVTADERTAVDPSIVRAADVCAANLVPAFLAFDPRVPYERQAPAALRRVNGQAWPVGKPAEPTAALVLRLLGLAERDRRIFLSYRRTDGRGVADQLRRALIDDGWDVFLDRFDVPPAEDFQQKLTAALDDKSFVLLIESPEVKTSGWVDHEISYALGHALGLRSLVLPTTNSEQLISRLDGSYRIEIPNGGIRRKKEGVVRLTARQRTLVLTQLQSEHAASYRLRCTNLAESALKMMGTAGCEIDQVAPWAWLGRRDHRWDVVSITGRAPAPADLWEVRRHMLDAPPHASPCRGWVVHPQEDPDTTRAQLVQWMCEGRSVGTTPVFKLRERLNR